MRTWTGPSGHWRLFVSFLHTFYLADRYTYSVASVAVRRRLSVTLCIVAKRCVL